MIWSVDIDFECDCGKTIRTPDLESYVTCDCGQTWYIEVLITKTGIDVNDG